MNKVTDSSETLFVRKNYHDRLLDIRNEIDKVLNQYTREVDKDVWTVQRSKKVRA